MLTVSRVYSPPAKDIFVTVEFVVIVEEFVTVSVIDVDGTAVDADPRPAELAAWLLESTEGSLLAVAPMLAASFPLACIDDPYPEA